MSPLEDLIPLGYQVARPPADAPVVDATAWRESDGSQFWVRPGDDEEAVVARVRNHVKLADKMEQAQTYFADNFANWLTTMGADKLLETASHTGGHGCTRYGHIDPDAAKRASAAFDDIVA